MFNWLKRLFGTAEVTLADKHAEASDLGRNALGFIHNLAADLEDSANGLHDVHAEASAEAQALADRAAQAKAEAAQNLAAANKIRSLVS